MTLKRKILIIVAVLALIVGCLGYAGCVGCAGCGNDYDAQTPEENRPTNSFSSGDEETQESVAETEAETEAEQSTQQETEAEIEAEQSTQQETKAETKEEQEDATKYEISEAGYDSLMGFVSAELSDSMKEMYPDAKAKKNKVGNIAIVDNRKGNSGYAKAISIGRGMSGERAYLIGFRFSNGIGQDFEYVGDGVRVLIVEDDKCTLVTDETAKNLDAYVK